MRKRLTDGLSLYVAPLLAALLIRLVGRTWRYTTVNRGEAKSVRPAGKGLIYAIWHGRMLPLAYMYRDRSVQALVSQHRDGEVASRIAARLGYGTVRGSSTRGGARGFQALLNKIHAGFDVVIMPDGPHGPACRVQPGVIRLAQLSGSRIVPVTHGVSKRTILNSWDGFIIPKPFSRCVVLYGDPIVVPSNASSAVCEEKRIELEQALNRMSREADGLVR